MPIVKLNLFPYIIISFLFCLSWCNFLPWSLLKSSPAVSRKLSSENSRDFWVKNSGEKIESDRPPDISTDGNSLVERHALRRMDKTSTNATTHSENGVKKAQRSNIPQKAIFNNRIVNSSLFYLSNLCKMINMITYVFFRYRRFRRRD